MGNLDFSAAGIEPASDFAAIPPGEYEVVIGATEIKATKAGDGKYLSLEHVVYGGEHNQRKIWSNLNLWNKSEMAVQIAQRQLSAICHAIGQLQISNHEELFGKKVVAVVDVEPDQNGKMRNVIKTYKPDAMSGGATPGGAVPHPRPATQPQQASTTSTAAAKKAAPWATK